ncbi:MAG: hypothetical protein JW774_10760 [Candidatus Aureabacteria bacterium]|nr:hypothetical protein [Candidatus Auribacterota bacterium]
MRRHLIIMLLIGFALYGSNNFVYSEEKSLEQKQNEVKKIGKELETKIKPGAKFTCQFLSDKLVSYGELALPEFTRLFLSDNNAQQNWGAYGLKKIKSEKVIDTVIQKFEQDKNNGKINYDAIRIVGAVGGQKAEIFLSEVMKSKIEISSLAASLLLEIKSHDKDAEDILLESFITHKGIRLALNSTPLFNNRREEVVDGAISILTDPKVSEWNWTDELGYASNILVRANYEKADEELIKAFDIQNNSIGRVAIIRSLSKIGTDRARKFIEETSNKSETELGGFLKKEIMEIRTAMK